MGLKDCVTIFLGHPGFGEQRPHFNIEGWNVRPDGIESPGKPNVNLHFFYPKSSVIVNNGASARR